MQNTLYTAYQGNVLCVLIVGLINKGYNSSHYTEPNELRSN